MRASVQELPAVEKPAEGSVGGGQTRNRPGQRPVQDLGALRRREMEQGDPRLPGNNGSWTDSGPTGGRRGTRQRGLGVGEERTREYLAHVAEKERALGEGSED